MNDDDILFSPASPISPIHQLLFPQTADTGSSVASMQTAYAASQLGPFPTDFAIVALVVTVAALFIIQHFIGWSRF